MNSFIVMQGETYQEEKQWGILWIPKTDKSGSVPHSYKRMEEVKKGDRVFHYVKGAIVAVSVVREDCRSARHPGEPEDPREGYLVKTTYHELEVPLDVRKYFREIKPHLPVTYSAFYHDATGNPGYLFPGNEELTIALMERISRLHLREPEAEQLELSMEVVRTREHDPLAVLIAETILTAKATLERNKSEFRRQLKRVWHGHCPLCGMDLDPALQASRAKPWKDSTGSERLDPYNGVLLCSNHDAMYQSGLIAFNGHGLLHVSSKLKEEHYPIYGLAKNMRIPVYPANRPYFVWHKRHVFYGK